MLWLPTNKQNLGVFETPQLVRRGSRRFPYLVKAGPLALLVARSDVTPLTARSRAPTPKASPPPRKLGRGVAESASAPPRVPRPKMLFDLAEDRRRVGHDSGVREAQNRKPLAPQVSGADLVVLDRRFMSDPIELDDQSAFLAREIDNVGTHGMLPSEAVTPESMIANALPEVEFGGSRPLAKQASGADAWIHKLVNA